MSIALPTHINRLTDHYPSKAIRMAYNKTQPQLPNADVKETLSNPKDRNSLK